MTKEELSKYISVKNEIPLLAARLLELEDSMENINSKITGMPSSGIITDRTASIVINIDEIRNLLNLKYTECRVEYNRLNSFILGIEDSEIRQILTLKYVNGLSWPGVAAAMGNAGDGSTEKKKHYRYLNTLKIP